MQKVFRVTVDISKKIPAPAFEVNTNDLKSVKLEITITNGQSLLDLKDVTPRINIRKPDNEVIFQDCEIVDATAGKVQIVLENQAYLVPGTHTAEIACYKGSEITAITGTFSYKSIKGIMNDEAVESKSEFTAIDRKLIDVQEILKDVRENGTGIDAQARQEVQQVTAQLAEKATKQDLERIGSASPKGTYATLVELRAAFPNGANDIYIVTADGRWYYWKDNDWTPGGVYQATGIPDDLVFRATNLLQNGDFSQGITAWSIYGAGGTWAADNGTLSITGNGATGQVGVYSASGYRYIGKGGHKIYMRARVRVTNPNASSLRFYVTDGTTNVFIDGKQNTIDNPQQDTWYTISGVVELPASFEGKNIQHYILAVYSSGTVANGKVIQISRPLVVDITQTYGAGFEPSISDFERFLSQFENNWFNGAKEITSVKSYIQNLNAKILELEKKESAPSEPYTIYDDFVSSTWVVDNAATTSLSKDRNKSLTNSESLKMTVVNSAGSAKAIDKQNVNVLLGEKNKMMLKVWIDEPSKINEMNLYLGNEDTMWTNYCRMRIMGNGEGNADVSGGLLRKGWNFIAIIPSEMLYTNNFNWNNPVKRMRITLTPKTNEATSAIIDSLSINGKGTPKIVITFDDAWKTVYDYAFPYMKERGILGTTYVIGSYVDNPNNPLSPDFCTLNQLKELRDAGWCLGNHTWQHNYYFGGKHTPESYLETVDKNRDWLIGRELGEGAYHFCYPNGEYSKGVVALLKARGYKSARAAKCRGAHPEKIDQKFEIISRNFTYQVTLDQAKKWVDYAIESGGTTFFQLHQIPLDDSTSNGNENPFISWSKAKFEALMDYIVEKGMASNCMTHDGWYEWATKNNLIQD